MEVTTRELGTLGDDDFEEEMRRMTAQDGEQQGAEDDGGHSDKVRHSQHFCMLRFSWLRACCALSLPGC